LGEVHMEDELRRMLGKIFPEGSDKCADCGHEIDSEYVKQEHIMLEHAWPTLVANVEEIEGAGKGKNAEESDIEEEKVEGKKAEENDMEEKEDADKNDEKSDKEENEDDLKKVHRNEKLLSEESDSEEETDDLINNELLKNNSRKEEEVEMEEEAEKEEVAEKEQVAEKEEVSEKEKVAEKEMETEKEKVVKKEMVAEKDEEAKKEESGNWSTGIYFTCKRCDHKIEPKMAKSHSETHGIKLKKDKMTEHYELVKKEYTCKICGEQVLHAENVIKKHTLAKHSMGLFEYENLYEKRTTYKKDNGTFLLPISSSDSSKNGLSPRSSEKDGMLTSERKWHQGILYECKKCIWKTFHKNSIQNHSKKIHKIRMQKHEYAACFTFEDNKYSCKICNTKVSHESGNIYQHIRKSHKMSVEVYELKYENENTLNFSDGEKEMSKTEEGNLISNEIYTAKVEEKRKMSSCDESSPASKRPKQSSDEVAIDDLHDILNQLESRIKSKTPAEENVMDGKETNQFTKAYLEKREQKENRSDESQIKDSSLEIDTADKDPEGDAKMIEDRIEFSDSSDDESD